MLVIDDADPLVMHLYIVRHRQDIRQKLPAQRHTASDILIFPKIAPYARAASAICKKGRIDHLLSLRVGHNTVMDNDMAFVSRNTASTRFTLSGIHTSS